MLPRWQSRLLSAASMLAMILACGNVALFNQNRTAQGALAQQQQFVQQTTPLEGLYRDIVKTLAETAVRGNDRQVLEMLASQGLNVTVNNAASKGDK
jgi:hypothetical protein